MNILIAGKISKNKSLLNGLIQKGFNLSIMENELENIHSLFSYEEIQSFQGIICNSFFTVNDIKRLNNLKFIHVTSAGLDRVPLKFCNDNNIMVFNIKSSYSQPISEWVLLYVLAIYKNFRFFLENMKNRKFIKKYDQDELRKKTVGILGYGQIGKEVAKRMKNVVDNIMVFDIKKPEDSQNFSMFTDNIEFVLRNSDIIVISLPLNSNTHNLIDKNKIDLMKEDCVLINVSRGNIINEIDLIDSLEDGKFKGVGLDVFSTEPLLENSKLWDFDRVIITPHISYYSHENKNLISIEILLNIERMMHDENINSFS